VLNKTPCCDSGLTAHQRRSLTVSDYMFTQYILYTYSCRGHCIGFATHAAWQSARGAFMDLLRARINTSSHNQTTTTHCLPNFSIAPHLILLYYHPCPIHPFLRATHQIWHWLIGFADLSRLKLMTGLKGLLFSTNSTLGICTLATLKF